MFLDMVWSFIELLNPILLLALFLACTCLGLGIGSLIFSSSEDRLSDSDRSFMRGCSEAHNNPGARY